MAKKKKKTEEIGKLMEKDTKGKVKQIGNKRTVDAGFDYEAYVKELKNTPIEKAETMTPKEWEYAKKNYIFFDKTKKGMSKTPIEKMWLEYYGNKGVDIRASIVNVNRKHGYRFPTDPLKILELKRDVGSGKKNKLPTRKWVTLKIIVKRMSNVMRKQERLDKRQFYKEERPYKKK